MTPAAPTAPAPPIDIIIPNYAVTDDITLKAIRCLETIRDNTTIPYRVVFVDNGSPDSNFRQILAVLQTLPYMLIRNRMNQGFIKATNQGICFSAADYVVLMNNDTEAVPGWLEKLRAPFEDPIVGLVGPRTTTPESWQGKWPTGEGWGLLSTRYMLAFFCVMISRRVLDAVGLLDEDFGPGLGDDDAYCFKAHRAGFRLALVKDLVIPHHHRTTFHTLHTPDEVKLMQNAAMNLFYEKRREL